MRRVIFPILLGLLGCGVLTGLGIWQVQRMHWKAGVLAVMEAQIAAPPVALMAAPDRTADRYRAVTVSGRFTGEFLEVLQGVVGTSPGVRIVEAFETDAGRRILIDRGFLPEAARSTPRPAHAATVTGNLVWPDDADSYTPPPDAKTGLWFARDADAMAAALQTEPVFVVAREQTGDGIAAQPVDTSAIPNNHWGYAITWFLLAITWAVMTAALLWRIRRRTA